MITTICPIRNINPTNQIHLPNKGKPKGLPIISTNVSFCGSRIDNGIIQKVMESISDKTLIGEGGYSKVYRFLDSHFDDYVIKVLKPNANTYPQLGELPKYNFGQAIRKVQDNIFILRKQKGVQHGLENWTEVYLGKDVTNEQAHNFAEDIKKISSMPDSTFDSFAERTKYVTDNGFKSDSINPNNLLIDYENNQINIIDYFRTNKSIMSKNSFLDMACSILDAMNFEHICNALPQNERNELIKNAKVILTKCYNSAQRMGLSTDKSVYEEYLSTVTRLLDAQKLLPSYKKFAELINM